MTDQYPELDFLRDFGEWHSYPFGNGDQRIEAVFPLRYPNIGVRSYRISRLKCVVAAIHNNIEMLVHDGMLRPEKLPGRNTVHLTNRLLRALHAYYGGIERKIMKTIPVPNWAAVIKIYDGLKED